LSDDTTSNFKGKTAYIEKDFNEYKQILYGGLGNMVCNKDKLFANNKKQKGWGYYEKI